MNRSATLFEPVARLLSMGRRPPPAPRVEVAAGPATPAWLLRLVVVATLAGSVALVARDDWHWLVAIVLLAGAATRPDGLAPSVMAGGVGLLLATAPFDPQPRVFVLVLALHLAVDLGAQIGPLSWEARVEWRVLARAGRGFLAIQAVAQALALLGVWVADRPPAMPWLPLMAAAALAVLAWTIVAQLRHRM